MNYTVQRILAAIALLLALPLMLLIGAVILLLNGAPVFYREQRLGKNKKRFQCIKFRTMKLGSSNWQLDARKTQEMAIYGKIRKDSRITRIGYILRRFSLDELPQLWNIVKGDMALIGPRPIVSKEDQIYGKYSSKLHSVKPGLTGLWQVSGRCLTTYRRRIAINMYYVRRRSLKLDLWILWKTIGAVLSGKGAF